MSQTYTISRRGHLTGTVKVPGDKSITHRAWIFNALADGTATITGGLVSDDTLATREALRTLGASIEGNTIEGTGGRLQPPEGSIDCGNSGTTIRLLLGLLAGAGVRATLTGDDSLRSRPMGRVTEPLRKMGARFSGAATVAPVAIEGGDLDGIVFRSPVASAQVKTALMLAAIQAPCQLDFEEPYLSRDHTERLLRTMGAAFQDTMSSDGTHRIVLDGPQSLNAVDIEVPGDISSAAFFLVGASIVPNSSLVIEGVGINPTRTGVLDTLLAMGADIDLLNQREVSGEPVADLHVRHTELKGIDIAASAVPRLIDELPILAVAMARAHGVSTVRGAGELKVKESDRLAAIQKVVCGLGAGYETVGDGYRVSGAPGLDSQGFNMDAAGDHRVAMTAIIAGLASTRETTVVGVEAISTSFPTFISTLEALRDQPNHHSH